MKNLFTLCFISVTVVLITLELVIRIFFAENMSGRFEYGYHPTAGFVEENDGTVNLVRAGGRRFRPQAFQMPKPEGTYRVFVVGDSVPRGPSLESAFAWQLQEMLRGKGVKAEVLNLGVAGYGVRRNQVVLKQTLQYQPDLIILHLNDSNEYEDEREWRRAEENKSWHPKNWLSKSLLIARLYELKTEKLFWYWLPQHIRIQAGVNDADAEVAAATEPEVMVKNTQRVRNVTLESLNLAQAEKVPVLILVPAKKNSASGEFSQIQTPSNLNALVQELKMGGYPLIEMIKSFSNEKDLNLLFSDSSHLRTYGHKVLANDLLLKILSDKL